MTHEDGVKHPISRYKMYGKTNMSQETILVLVSAGIRITEDQTHTHTEAHQRKTRMKLLIFLIKFINPIMSLRRQSDPRAKIMRVR
jgi:hypothetical protein